MATMEVPDFVYDVLIPKLRADREDWLINHGWWLTDARRQAQEEIQGAFVRLSTNLSRESEKDNADQCVGLTD